MEKWKSRKMNAEWKKYNDLFNEGEGGYNPHRKFIETSTDKKNIFNRMMTVLDVREMLLKLESSLPKHTDAKKIQGCKDYIEILTNLLKHEVEGR
jgi:hypothetical protein